MKKILLALTVLFSLTSCARTYYINSSTVADERYLPAGFPTGSSFHVVSAKNQEDLFDREVGLKIEDALVYEGFKVKEGANADFRLEYAYLLDETITQEYAPVYHPSGSYRAFGHLEEIEGEYSFHERAYFYGSTHYVPIEVAMTNYDLEIKVYDTKTNQLVWQGYAAAEDCEDERVMICYLIEIAMKNFGCDSAELQSYQVKAK